MGERINESDLVIPALWIIAKAEGDEISTTDLQQALREILQPIGEDLEILAGRSDDKFSQKVRNLRSHQTLEIPGYVTYEYRGSNGYWRITVDGTKLLEQSDLSFLDYLFTNDFEYDDVQPAVKSIEPSKTKAARRVLLFDEDAVINEGKQRKVQQKVYNRSAKLRSAAVAHYTKHGRIVCQVCSFDFQATYGELGEGFIEIHHLKPVYAYDEADVEQTIRKAVKNTVPVCSNCHRMIHKRRDNPLTICELREIVTQHAK